MVKKVEVKIQIKKWFSGTVLYESEKETIKEALQEAALQDADLRGADLRGIGFEKLPQKYIDDCSRDILYVLHYLRDEVPFLRKKLIAGEVDGSQYSGDCACLVGSLAKAEKDNAKYDDVEKFCKAIPFYTMGTHNMGESWFLNIRKGDTPDNNGFAKHALTLIDMVMKEDK